MPACAALDAHVRRVHWLAREGRIDAQTAERHLNAHLAAASLPPEAARLPWVRWLAMPLTDAPQFGNLPDLWPPLHQALSAPEFRAQPGLPGLILQTLPCFRRPAPSGGGEPSPPPAPAEGLAPLLINLALALLLGLYPDATAKPQFRVRARVFGSLHAVLTAGPEAQERFVRARLALATLALMEYLARVLPALMPVEEELLRHTFGMGAFFEQVPLLCSEFRSALAGLAREPGWRPLAEADWAELDARAAEAVERAARVKRKPPRPCEPRRPAEEAAPEWRTALACPAVPSGSPDDYKILAHAYRLPNHGADVERFHALIQLGSLPPGLARLQREALARQSADWRCVWMRARLHMCPACLARRSVSVLRHELRVDTLSGRLACSECRCPEVLAVDLLASVGLICTAFLLQATDMVMAGKVHDHQVRQLHPVPLLLLDPPVPQGQRAALGAGLLRAQAPGAQGAAPAHQVRRLQRVSPGRPAPHARTLTPRMRGRKHQPPLVERIDHLTGEMQQFGFCLRHTPPRPFLDRCASAKELMAWGAHVRRGLPWLREPAP